MRRSVPTAGKLPQTLRGFGLALMLVFPTVGLADACSNGCKVLSRDGGFQVTARPALERLPLRRHHDWIVVVQDGDGNPVKLNGLSVSGGMQGHGHGLPSQPKVTEYLGEGRYRITGFLFNMHGEWTLRFHLATPDIQDVADLTLTLDY
ncbi:FixH family protein [Marinobacter salicampi]|uniref:FixH family protein n=1 Tax=Marinobacter salicampi TaxID=435907 RepID=UPI00140E3F13|nr:FixH family protein [Marinobacter salicampi]